MSLESDETESFAVGTQDSSLACLKEDSDHTVDSTMVISLLSKCPEEELDESDPNDATTSGSTPYCSEEDLDSTHGMDAVRCGVSPQASSEITEETAELAELPTPPPGCSEHELDRRLRGLRWRLECACEGTLRNQEMELPLLIESIRVTTGWLVWGEKYCDTSFLDVFRKHTMFEAFSLVLRADACPTPIKIQVMQTISILMPEVRHAASVNYLLSVLNPFFEIPPDLENEEVLAYFVTILKSLARQLDRNNVQYCILDGEGRSVYEVMNEAASLSCNSDLLTFHMPVLDCAVNLVDHQESMAQIAAQTAILKIIKLEHPGVRMISEDVMKKRLVPKLAGLVSDRRRRGNQKCKWMWGDAVTGKIAQRNPLRWSEEKRILETLGDIRGATGNRLHRPIIVKFSLDRAKRHYKSVSDAVTALEEILDIPINGFIQDLFSLGIRMVTQVLQSHGFAASSPLEDTLFLPQ